MSRQCQIMAIEIPKFHTFSSPSPTDSHGTVRAGCCLEKSNPSGKMDLINGTGVELADTNYQC